jgi:gamma-glutamyltranspeptidase/glutathione hydrolase
MRGRAWTAALGLVATTALLWATIGAYPPPWRGRGVVAADHPLASAAGAEVLRAGGNAVDAAVAAALAAGVVQPAGSGLGGGGFAVTVAPGSSPYVLDFREVAPRSARRDQYLGPDGSVVPGLSVKGPLAVAVPGEPRGLWRLLRERGRISPAAVAAPAIRLARGGFPVGGHLASSLAKTKDAEVIGLFTIGASVAAEGVVFRNPALAKTLQAWVRSEGESMSRGPGAAAIAAEIGGRGLDAEDLGAWQPTERQPITFSYRGYRVITMPPPSSGGVALGEILTVLEGYDLRSVAYGSADHLHLVAEALKHAYADRAHFLGDPAFVAVPVDRLLSREHTDDIRRKIYPGRTFGPDAYGAPIAPPTDDGTQHISAIDADGTAIALTTTINTSFGSGLVVESLGLILNNEMDDFSAAPGVANAFGLVGGEANSVAPGKRPLSSMSPTIVLDPQGRVVLSVGASGGAQIISSVAQAISNVIDFGMDPEAAVSAPRIHHQWQPDELVVEPEFAPEVAASLAARGHVVVRRRLYSAVEAVGVDPTGYAGGADPRKGGEAVGAW